MQHFPQEELGHRISEELTDVFLHFVAADQAYRQFRLKMPNEDGFDLDKPFLSWVPISVQ
jgi:hypothetical protein